MLQIKFLAKQEKSLKSLINKAGKMIRQKSFYLLYIVVFREFKRIFHLYSF